jgi:hypothetical protein
LANVQGDEELDMRKLLFALTVGVLLQGCGGEPSGEATFEYYDNSGRTDARYGF